MAASKLTPQLAMHAQQQSSFFSQIPPELRNRIYAYVFDGSPQAGHIEMDHATRYAPQIDLVLTCQRVRIETLGLYQASYPEFWSANTFVITTARGYDKKQIKSKHINAMNHIVLGKPRIQVHLTPVHPLLVSAPRWELAFYGDEKMVARANKSRFRRHLERDMTSTRPRQKLAKKVPARTERYVLVEAEESEFKMCDLDRLLDMISGHGPSGFEDKSNDIDYVDGFD